MVHQTAHAESAMYKHEKTSHSICASIDEFVCLNLSSVSWLIGLSFSKIYYRNSSKSILVTLKTCLFSPSQETIRLIEIGYSGQYFGEKIQTVTIPISYLVTPYKIILDYHIRNISGHLGLILQVEKMDLGGCIHGK